MSLALVTVIVAGRDIAAYAHAALDSLIAQTEPRWRAIVIDDGSLDATGEIFREYAARDSRFEVIANRESVGLGAARNQGLDRATTEYIAFLDADDVARPHMLATALAHLQQSGSDIAVGTYVRLRLLDGAWVTGPVQPWARASVTPPRAHVSLDEHPAVVGNIVAWSKVSRRSLWQRTATRFPPGVLYEDQATSQQLYVAARGIDLIDEVFVEWRIREQATSITQREADPAVFADCVEQMHAGLTVLAAASATAAATRTTQILRMDLPRLAAVAQAHPDSQARLGAFARSLTPTDADLALLTQSPANPTDPAAPTVGSVYALVSGW